MYNELTSIKKIIQINISPTYLHIQTTFNSNFRTAIHKLSVVQNFPQTMYDQTHTHHRVVHKIGIFERFECLHRRLAGQWDAN